MSVIATRQQIGRSLDKPRRRKVKASRKTTPGDLEKAAAAPLSGIESELSGNESSASASAEEYYDDSFIGIAKEIIDEEGPTGLWLGIKPGLVLTVNPAITYGLYERVKSMMLLAHQKTGDTSGKLSPWATFTVGALSKTLATVVSRWSFSHCRFVITLLNHSQVTYPYIMAKVRIQARSADVEDAVVHQTPKPQPYHFHHEKSKHVGALDILARVWRKEGFVGWYQVNRSLSTA